MAFLVKNLPVRSHPKAHSVCACGCNVLYGEVSNRHILSNALYGGRLAGRCVMHTPTHATMRLP